MKVWMPVISTNTGAEVYGDLLADGLRARGHQVVVDKVAHRFQYMPWLAGISPPPDTDVTLANSWTAAAFDKGPPLVTVVHHVVHDPALTPFKSLGQTLFHRLYVRPMERAALRRSRRVLAVSQATAQAVKAHLAACPVTVVLNGVDTDYFSPAPQPAQQPQGPMRLLFVGKRSRRKGYDLVGALMTSLGDRGALTVIGHGAEPGLEIPGVQELGFVDQSGLRAAYRAADFLLFPSRLEGFGLVAAEAMACGLPVLCISGGAVAEVVDPPRGGIALPADQVDTLGARALALFEDTAAYARTCETARQRAVADLGHARWLDEMEAALASVAGSGTQ